MNHQQHSLTEPSSDPSTPEEPFDKMKQRICEEVEGLCDLGLDDEARQCAEAALTRWESEFVRGRAMHLALRQMDFAAAARHAEALLGAPEPISSELRDSIPTVFHYVGRDQQALELLRSQVQSESAPSPNTWYNLACYALPVGEKEESLQALLRSFAAGNPPEWEPWSKAFLDSELAPLWDYVGEREYTLQDAVEWACYPLEAVLGSNQNPWVLRQLDYGDMAQLPRKFRGLLARCGQNTARVDQRKASRHRRVFQSYLRWEAGVCGPRVQAFAHLVGRVREVYDRHVPDMVRFCIARQRHGSARYILRQFLRRKPTTDPCSLPEFPGLEYWTDEWKELRQVSPEGFAMLLNSTSARGTLALQQGFDELPERLRDSGLGWMWWGKDRFRLGHYEEALEAYVHAARFWPLDDAVVCNIITCLMELGRSEEAVEMSNHPCLLVWPQMEREYLLQAILDGRAAVAPLTRWNADFPTPSVNEMTDRSDKEFFSAMANEVVGLC
jgi:tetratricopeptide (TPR) repeat protein